VTVLDRVLPDYADNEVHETAIAAPVEATWRAMRAVTPGELPFSLVLAGLRSLPVLLRGRDRVANRPHLPLLDQFLGLGFGVLVDEPPRALVAGGIGKPWLLHSARIFSRDTPAEFAAFSEPGFLQVALSLEVTTVDGGSRLRTETRVRPTDRAAALAFAPYWLVVKPFSSLIRRDLLRAVRRRAERSLSSRTPAYTGRCAGDGRPRPAVRRRPRR
jgi:hypothetical protein